MYKIYYKVRSAKEDGTGTVYVMLRCANGEEVTRTTGVSVTVKEFNKTTGKVSAKDILHREKNEAIRLLVVDLEDAAFQACYNEKAQKVELTKAGIEAEYPNSVSRRRGAQNLKVGFTATVENRIPDLEAQIERLQRELAEAKQLLRRQRGQDENEEIKRDLFSNRIDEFILVAKSMKKEATRKNYLYLKSVMRSWNPQLQIQEVNLKMLTELQHWLATKPNKDGSRWRNSSILNVLTLTRAVYEYFADDLGLPTAFFKKFEKVKYLANENVVYLDALELDEFANVSLKGDLQLQVREQFLVFCETGLRQVDGCISRAAVYEVMDRKGRKYKEIRLNQEKVNSLVSIPLSKRAEEILERNNYSFTPIPNNHFNQALKQIAQKVQSLQREFTVTNFNGASGIPSTKPKWHFISSKVGRKTFVNNCFERQVSETTVAAWLGHKNTIMVQKHYKHRGDIAKAEAHKIFQ
ncbi:hypothetical protein AUC43_13010 [Hymenobacter sedentarius]|uniref:Tyr recombinase domain-containing protein n=1 Tax=Hymenobacter sedentarius TaxID=1411621 RepID=A0A0U3K025_9BACT|nr:hypothetical protein [Hymenobacter sedentarius]ALW85935.1 hypothetical protein AUC43_13010 [Hymenobacter sedentarius]